MNYSLEFKNVVKNAIDQKMYIGEGNPDAKILIIGKELGQNGVPDDEFQCDSSVSLNFKEWAKNINTGIKISYDDINDHNPLFALKGKTKTEISTSAGHTWNKYQKINNLVFNLENTFEYNFHKTVFITELNQSPAKQSKNAPKHSIEKRISFFSENQFYQQFPIVILACGTYIKPQEIYDTFGVKYIENGEFIFGTKSRFQKFWVHESVNNIPKLVIHVRQLSGPIYNALLESIASEVNRFISKHKIEL